jgi:hypothetical protein
MFQRLKEDITKKSKEELIELVSLLVRLIRNEKENTLCSF